MTNRCGREHSTCIETYAIAPIVTEVMPWSSPLPRFVAFASASAALGHMNICLSPCQLSAPWSLMKWKAYLNNKLALKKALPRVLRVIFASFVEE